MSRKQRKQRPTFRQICDASPMIQRNLFMAAVSFGLVVIALAVCAIKALFF